MDNKDVSSTRVSHEVINKLVIKIKYLNIRKLTNFELIFLNY